MDIRGHVGPTGDGNVGIRSRRWSLATWMRPSRKSVWQEERKSFWPDLQKEHLGKWAGVKGGERGPNTGARSRQSKETSGGLRQKPAGHTEPAALESHPGALSWLSRDGD